MSKFEKGNLTVNGDTLQLSMPFTKVNKEKRTVSGYATLDNIDSQGDVVTAEASAKAFSRARGNLREMHDKIAVGRVVDFYEDEYFDQDSGELYRGIYVTAYVSKGAESTWEKVLDGTLTGFSIGGEINEASNEFVKDANRTVRFIKDYDLVELSLVDNPANQLANVFSIQKSATGSVTVKGMVAETQIESVFVCKNDGTVTVKMSDSAVCPACEAKMENAGWFEQGGTDRAEKVKEIVNKFLSPTDTEAAPDTSEGGVEMAKGEFGDTSPVAEGKEVDGPLDPSETFTDGEKVDETTKEENKSETVDEAEDVEEEEAASPEEVEVDDEEKIEKKLGELQEAINDSLTKTRQETAEHVAVLEKKIDELSQEWTAKSSELDAKLSKFGEQLETTKAHQAELEKSFARLNDSEAFRKSADIENEDVAEPVQESLWKGAFSGKRFSIDNHI